MSNAPLTNFIKFWSLGGALDKGFYGILILEINSSLKIVKYFNFSSILFEVWDWANNVNAGDFEWKDIEYPEGIQKIIDDIKKE